MIRSSNVLTSPGGLTAVGWGFSAHHEVVARRDKGGWTSLEVTCDVSHPSGVGLTVLKRMLAGVRPGRFELATLTRKADRPAEQLVRRVARRVERAEG